MLLDLNELRDTVASDVAILCCVSDADHTEHGMDASPHSTEHITMCKCCLCCTVNKDNSASYMHDLEENEIKATLLCIPDDGLNVCRLLITNDEH